MASPGRGRLSQQTQVSPAGRPELFGHRYCREGEPAQGLSHRRQVGRSCCQHLGRLVGVALEGPQLLIDIGLRQAGQWHLVRCGHRGLAPRLELIVRCQGHPGPALDPRHAALTQERQQLAAGGAGGDQRLQRSGTDPRLDEFRDQTQFVRAHGVSAEVVQHQMSGAEQLHPHRFVRARCALALCKMTHEFIQGSALGMRQAPKQRSCVDEVGVHVGHRLLGEPGRAEMGFAAARRTRQGHQRPGLIGLGPEIAFDRGQRNALGWGVELEILIPGSLVETLRPGEFKAHEHIAVPEQDVVCGLPGRHRRLRRVPLRTGFGLGGGQCLVHQSGPHALGVGGDVIDELLQFLWAHVQSSDVGLGRRGQIGPSGVCKALAGIVRSRRSGHNRPNLQSSYASMNEGWPCSRGSPGSVGADRGRTMVVGGTVVLPSTWPRWHGSENHVH